MKTTQLEPTHVRTDAVTATNGTDGQVLAALLALREGDFAVRLPTDWVGIEGKIADTFNDIATANDLLARELARISRVVGKEGKVRQRAHFSTPAGAWRHMEDSVNNLITDLVWPTSEVIRSISAVAKGDLS